MKKNWDYFQVIMSKFSYTDNLAGYWLVTKLSFFPEGNTTPFKKSICCIKAYGGIIS